MPSLPLLQFNPHSNQLVCSGDWTLANEKTLALAYARLSTTLPLNITDTLSLEGSTLQELDSVGIWWLDQCRELLKKNHFKLQLQGFSEQHLSLLKLITEKLNENTTLPERPQLPWVAELGKQTVESSKQSLHFISFIGELSLCTFRLLAAPARIPWKIIFNLIQTVGYNALPIVGLLSFLIGIVLAYQMGQQLRSYGANIYIVDLLGLSILREFAPMMTAIIIAGRSGSAFTAQIGTMKVNQEIDALSTLGINPIERLAVPKLIALVLALPLLTVWADMTGIIGGMIMSQTQLGIDFPFFMHRFVQNVPLKWYVIGLVKTPIYAMLIASIGCFQGLMVKSNADSVGANTTKSVVESIFTIITFDAFFSILLSWLKI